MATQQVITPPAPAAMFLVLTVREGAEENVREFLADLPGLTRGVGFRAIGAGLDCVLGIGAELWDRMYAAARPAGLHTFEAIDGPTHRAVSTPGDLLVHLRAARMDLCFELAHRITDRLRGSADVVDEVHGFKFFDQRDLLGFVDGTENPEGADADAAVFVGPEDSAHTGSSYVLVQKYLHDLDAWGQLSVEEQEAAIGRTKLEDVEFSDEAKAPNSHLALNSVTDADGNDLDILRDNMPFGSVGAGEFGTYFIGYAADPGVIEQMLRNMFLGDPPGNHDRILDFSTAITGTLFFVPTVGFLEDQPDAAEPSNTVQGAGRPAADAESASLETSGDDSLGIGSLRN